MSVGRSPLFSSKRYLGEQRRRGQKLAAPAVVDLSSKHFFLAPECDDATIEAELNDSVRVESMVRENDVFNASIELFVVGDVSNPGTTLQDLIHCACVCSRTSKTSTITSCKAVQLCNGCRHCAVLVFAIWRICCFEGLLAQLFRIIPQCLRLHAFSSSHQLLL